MTREIRPTPTDIRTRTNEIIAHVIPTFRTITPNSETGGDYSTNLGFKSEEDAIAFFSGKGNNIVVDLGSGLSGFAFDAARQHLSFTVISVDPHQLRKNFLEQQRKAIDSFGFTSTVNPNQPLTEGEINAALARVRENSVPTIAQAIDSNKIHPASVDIVVDNYAVSLYSKEPDAANGMYEAYIGNALVILKQNGKLLIGDYTLDSQDYSAWKWHILMRLKDEGRIDYKPIYAYDPKRKRDVIWGVAVTKL